jgi:hypothetical protein
MGHYLGDYSKAQCMFWGKQQGCNFVTSRCGTRRDDRAVQLDGGTAGLDGGLLSFSLPISRLYGDTHYI